MRYRPRAPRRLEPDGDGRVSAAALNAEFDSLYLEEEANPRWVAKPAVAYLWARTVRCSGCRAEIPLLKTRWLCRKAGKRVVLTMEPRADGAGVTFGVARDAAGDDGAGTMNRSGAACPCCGVITTMVDIRVEGRAGRLGERMTAVIVDGQQGKEYRLPTETEIEAARVDGDTLAALYADIPFGIPDEAIVAERPSPNSRGASGDESAIYITSPDVAQLARGLRAAALRLRHVARGLHQPATARARRVRAGDTPLLRGNGRRLSRRVA